MILTHLILFSFLGGASAAELPPPEPVVTETPSGGWRPSKPVRRHETEPETEAEPEAVLPPIRAKQDRPWVSLADVPPPVAPTGTAEAALAAELADRLIAAHLAAEGAERLLRIQERLLDDDEAMIASAFAAEAMDDEVGSKRQALSQVLDLQNRQLAAVVDRQRETDLRAAQKAAEGVEQDVPDASEADLASTCQAIAEAMESLAVAVAEMRAAKTLKVMRDAEGRLSGAEIVDG